jgi:hypothetical protein
VWPESTGPRGAETTYNPRYAAWPNRKARKAGRQAATNEGLLKFGLSFLLTNRHNRLDAINARHIQIHKHQSNES